MHNCHHPSEVVPVGWVEETIGYLFCALGTDGGGGDLSGMPGSQLRLERMADGEAPFGVGAGH